MAPDNTPGGYPYGSYPHASYPFSGHLPKPAARLRSSSSDAHLQRPASPRAMPAQPRSRRASDIGVSSAQLSASVTSISSPVSGHRGDADTPSVLSQSHARIDLTSPRIASSQRRSRSEDTSPAAPQSLSATYPRMGGKSPSSGNGKRQSLRNSTRAAATAAAAHLNELNEDPLEGASWRRRARNEYVGNWRYRSQNLVGSTPKPTSKRDDMDDMWAAVLKRFPQYPHWNLVKEKDGVYHMGAFTGKRIHCRISRGGLQVRVGGGWMGAVPFLQENGPSAMGTRPGEESTRCKDSAATPMERHMLPTKSWAEKTAPPTETAQIAER